MPENFTLTERPHGSCWLHNSKHFWIVHYPSLQAAGKPSYHTYIATDFVPEGRDPWTVNNRRAGQFNTLEQAMLSANS